MDNTAFLNTDFKVESFTWMGKLLTRSSAYSIDVARRAASSTNKELRMYLVLTKVLDLNR